MNGIVGFILLLVWIVITIIVGVIWERRRTYYFNDFQNKRKIEENSSEET